MSATKGVGGWDDQKVRRLFRARSIFESDRESIHDCDQIRSDHFCPIRIESRSSHCVCVMLAAHDSGLMVVFIDSSTLVNYHQFP